MKIDVCAGDNLTTLYSSEADADRTSRLDDPNSFRRTKLSQTSNYERKVARLDFLAGTPPKFEH